MENLNQLRIDFPEHKILVPRQPTRHDLFLAETKQNHFVLSEETKYKKARCFQLAKAAKKQVLKNSIKQEEKSMFQRVVYSYLAESVRQKFESIQLKKNVEEEKDIVNPEINIQRPMNDGEIFIEQQQSGNNDEQEMDLFGDLLKEEGFQKNQEEDIISENAQAIEPVIRHIEKVVEKDPQVNKYHFRTVNRKQCLKKINQNLRKRIKTKGNNEQVPQKNLNSATVSIANIINMEPEPKSSERCIQICSSLDYLQNTENKQKKKKDESFDLKWGEEDLEKFHEINGKDKFDANYLLLQLENNDIQYEKHFEKNIKERRTFPPQLNQLPKLQNKFKKKYFYNQITDHQYEDFLIRHNKKGILQKFKNISPYVTSDSYNHEYNRSKNLNVAKMFLSQDAIQSDRLIYKIKNHKLISANSIQEQLTLSEQELLQLSFLVRKYLSLFGNNWKIIRLFISIHPTFSQMSLSLEQIQQFHQIARRKYETNGQILQVYSSRVLPFQVYTTSSYEEYRQNLQCEIMEEEYSTEKMDIQQEAKDFDFSSYEKMINEPLREEDEPSPYAFENTQQSFKKFVQNTKKMQVSKDKLYLIDNLNKILGDFKNGEQRTKANFGKTQKKPYSYEQMTHLNQQKFDFKVGYPFRKKKFINDKTSELVKILQSLKTKYGTQSSRAPVGNQQRPPPPNHQPISKVNPNVNQTPTVQGTKDPNKLRPASIPKPEKLIQSSEKKLATKGGVSSKVRRKKDQNDDK